MNREEKFNFVTNGIALVIIVASCALAGWVLWKMLA